MSCQDKEAMEKDKRSKTSKSRRETAVQGTNDSSIVSKCSMSLQGYFDDPYLKGFVSKVTRRAPLIHRGYYIRAKTIDYILKKFLECNHGDKQIISLGAGFDSAYFRLKSQKLLQETVFFEVDFPEVVKRKHALIDLNPDLLALIGEGTSLIPDKCDYIEMSTCDYKLLGADLSQINTLEAALKLCHIDFELPTLLLSECVLTYMTRRTASGVVRWANETFANSVFVLYEQIYPTDAFGLFMQNHFQTVGSPLKCINFFPTIQAQKDRFTQMGWRNLEVLDMNEFYNMMLDDIERDRVEKLEMFDEYEEWHLKCAHYMVLLGYNGNCNQLLSGMMKLTGIKGSEVVMDVSEISPEDLPQYRDDFSRDDFNGYLSDIISMHRIVDDYRPDICKNLRYPEVLPEIGVVIPFKDEHLSVLLRTVYSILYNTPSHIVKEIVLVDDGSENSELKSTLDIYLENMEKVRVIRLRKSVGLMMARQAGINSIGAEYFVCLDCHMEVLPGWIEPLLSRLLEEPKALLCSNVGSIDRLTFKLHHAELPQIRYFFPFLIFNLDASTGKYKQSFVESRTNDTEPFPFGIIQGMMVVMRKSWFMQLGGFDPGMKIWGSEQIELSIKVWTCGGRVEMIPCSFVAHMYRRNVWRMRNEGVVNILRVADVWLDDHKNKIHEYYFSRRKQFEIGDVSDRIRIRKENKCKPFDFYLEKIREFADFEFTEIRKNGAIKNLETEMCLDPLPSKKGPIQYWCHGDEIQYSELTELGKLRFQQHCMLPLGPNSTTLRFCTTDIHNETEAKWDYTEAGQLKHVASGRCLTAADDKKTIQLTPCVNGNRKQEWSWYVMK